MKPGFESVPYNPERKSRVSVADNSNFGCRIEFDNRYSRFIYLRLRSECLIQFDIFEVRDRKKNQMLD